ncbi:hypothetical protein SLA2020_037850 [Shorea laevis]
MALIGVGLLSSPTSLFVSSSLHRRRCLHTHQPISKFCVTPSCNDSKELMAEPEVSTTERANFGFKNLTETFWVDALGLKRLRMSLSPFGSLL